MGDAEELPVVVASLQLNGNEEERPDSSIIDVSTGTACFATSPFAALYNPGRIVKISLGEGTAPPERICMLQGNLRDVYLMTGAIDPENGYAYFSGVEGVDAVKLELGDAVNAPAIIHRLQAPFGTQDWLNAAIDAPNGYLYLLADTYPATIVKFGLGNGSEPLRYVGEVTLNEFEGYPGSSFAIDPRGMHLYYCTEQYPAPVIVKIACGDGDDPPVRIGAGTLNEGDVYSLSTSVIDPINGYIYIGSNAGKIIKIALGEGDDLPVRIGELVIATPFELSAETSVIDYLNGFAYFSFVNDDYQTEIIKVELGEGNLLPEITGSISIPEGTYDWFPEAGIDTHGGYALYVSSQRLVKIRLGVGEELPEFAGELLRENLTYPTTAVVDSRLGYGYISSGNHPALIERAALSNSGFIKGSKATMVQSGAIQSISTYSHRAAGNLRVAIYSAGAEPLLLWASPEVTNTVDDGWMEIAIEDGEPAALNLSPGDYWLVWQTNSTGDVLSHSEGQDGEGITMRWNWGDFPGNLDAEPSTQPVLTADRWSIFVRYADIEPTVTPTPIPPTPTPTETPDPATPTPTPGCDQMGCAVFMPSTDFTAGELCWCDVTVCNDSGAILNDTPVFVILDAYGNYFFAPSFNAFDFYDDPIPPGETVISVLPAFNWPDNAGAATNIHWFAAMTDPQVTSLVGDLGTFTFGWH